eukprot:2251187-Pyramimonas_sp.AAC.1
MPPCSSAMLSASMPTTKGIPNVAHPRQVRSTRFCAKYHTRGRLRKECKKVISASPYEPLCIGPSGEAWQLGRIKWQIQVTSRESRWISSAPFSVRTGVRTTALLADTLEETDTPNGWEEGAAGLYIGGFSFYLEPEE